MQSFWNTKASIGDLALTIVLSVAAMPTTAVAAADGLRFMVFGDAPYTRTQREVLKNTVAPAIRNAESSFLIHLGDFKAGKEPCTDALIETRYKQLMDLRPERVFYTPGDNEWTDCDRTSLQPRFSELERLDFLRNLISSRPMALPPGWHYATQPKFPENARWLKKLPVIASNPVAKTIMSNSNSSSSVLIPLGVISWIGEWRISTSSTFSRLYVSK